MCENKFFEIFQFRHGDQIHVKIVFKKKLSLFLGTKGLIKLCVYMFFETIELKFDVDVHLDNGFPLIISSLTSFSVGVFDTDDNPKKTKPWPVRLDVADA